jgi:hypothetical protein
LERGNKRLGDVKLGYGRKKERERMNPKDRRIVRKMT